MVTALLFSVIVYSSLETLEADSTVSYGVVISHHFAFQKAYFYYKIVNCSKMQEVEQELERLLPGKSYIQKIGCFICIILMQINVAFVERVS